MEHDMLGQNGTSWGQTETEIQGKMAYSNNRMSWECFGEFTSACSVLSDLGMSNFNASMVVYMNNGLGESQIDQSY